MTRDSDLADALASFEVARLTFLSYSNTIAKRLAAGGIATEQEIRWEQEAREAIVAARARLMALLITTAHSSTRTTGANATSDGLSSASASA